MLIIIHRWLKGRWIVWLAPIALLSFALSVWGVMFAPSATFYLAPTRAWELLLGSLVALTAPPRSLRRLVPEVSQLIGLGLIGWGIFGLSAESSFPGPNALFPCLGATLIIYFGQGSPTGASTLLGSRPLVFIGLISYSLYLWHWPLLVFAQAWSIYVLDWFETALVIGMSFFAASFSWKFVELPFRKRGGVFDQKGMFAAVTVSTAVFAAFGMYGHLTEGWPERVSPVAIEIAAYSGSQNPRRDECSAWADHPIPASEACDFGANVSPSYAVWGDSHAEAALSGIGKIAAKHDKSVKFFGSFGCPPVLDIGRVGQEYLCIFKNTENFNYIIQDNEIKNIIMISRYIGFISGQSGNLGPAERANGSLTLITDDGSIVSDFEGRQRVFRKELAETVEKLISSGKRVLLVYPIPEVGYNVPPTLARLVRRGRAPESFTHSFSSYMERQKPVFDILDGLGQSDQITRIYPHKRLCNSTDCIVYANGRPLYYDDDHLSLAGADFLAPLFEPLFASDDDQVR